MRHPSTWSIGENIGCAHLEEVGVAGHIRRGRSGAELKRGDRTASSTTHVALLGSVSTSYRRVLVHVEPELGTRNVSQ